MFEILIKRVILRPHNNSIMNGLSSNKEVIDQVGILFLALLQ